jgi:hypothetical protein
MLDSSSRGKLTSLHFCGPLQHPASRLFFCLPCLCLIIFNPFLYRMMWLMSNRGIGKIMSLFYVLKIFNYPVRNNRYTPVLAKLKVPIYVFNSYVFVIINGVKMALPDHDCMLAIMLLMFVNINICYVDIINYN